MSDKSCPRPESLSLDVDQWRREIEMFAQSTEQAIAAIVSDFSNHSNSASLGDSNLHVGTKNDSSVVNDSGQDRLAKLKEQLAKRLTKN
jgi:hypothetical protein